MNTKPKTQHPANRAMTTKEFDALWPKEIHPDDIRPLTPMVSAEPCPNCERLTAENEALQAENTKLWFIAKQAKTYLDTDVNDWKRLDELQDSLWKLLCKIVEDGVVG